jgi:hypothetical protein
MAPALTRFWHKPARHADRLGRLAGSGSDPADSESSKSSPKCFGSEKTKLGTKRSQPPITFSPSVGQEPLVEIVFAILVILVVLKMTQFVRMGSFLPKRTARTRLESERYGNHHVGRNRLIFVGWWLARQLAREWQPVSRARGSLAASPRSPWDPASDGQSPKQSLVPHRHKLSINFRSWAPRLCKRFKIAVSLEPRQSKEICLSKRQSLGLESRIQQSQRLADS